MASDQTSTPRTNSARSGLLALVSTTLAMSFGIAIAAAGIIVAAGMWLERF